MKSLRSCFAIAYCLFAATSFAQPRVEIPGSQLHSISSSIVGREYNLLVQFPRGYDDQTQSFPVVFVLDAQWDFPLVQAIYGSQYYDGFVPAFVIVGITWGGVNPRPDSLRGADLTPTNARGIPHSGNGPKFLSFIKSELIPFVESKFRVTSNRTLMGSSFGGLFTLYAMFQETGLFQRYVLTSPAIGFDNSVIYDFEKNYAKDNSSLPVRLFMAHGEVEGGVPVFEKWAQHLNEREYKGLQMQTRILENTGHSGTKAEGYTRGLQWVFERPSLTLSESVLNAYEGEYEMGSGRRERVTAEDGRLVVTGPYNQLISLHAEGNDSFYAKGYFMNVRFKRDASGNVAGVDVEQYGGTFSLKKVSD